MINKAILVGRVGKDPEVKYTNSGTAVANYSVATNERWKKDGETHERTEWHRIVSFGKLAEICGEYLSKGQLVYIDGKIQTREWEDRDGNKRYTTEIRALRLQLLGSRDDRSTSPQPSGAARDESADEPADEPSGDAGFDDDDIPF